MKHFLGLLHSFLHPLYETPGTQSGGGATGTGTGTGTGAGTGAGGREGATGAGAGTGTGAGGGSGSTGPYEFRDDAQYRLHDGRIVTGKDLRAEMEQQIDGTYREKYNKGYELLLNEARRIDALSRARTGQGQQPPQDPIADIRSMPIVDGQTIGRLVDMLQRQGLGPIAQLVQQQQQKLAAMERSLQQTTQRFGSQDEDAEAQRFESRLDTVLDKVEVKGLNGKLDPSSPALRTFARNLFLSYVPSSWKSGEFEHQLGNELSELLSAVREMDRKAVFDGKEKLKQHFNPNRGGRTPGGPAKYKFESPREIAAKARDAGMFGGSFNQT